MSYLYVGATGEADAEALSVVRKYLSSTFPVTIRDLQLPAVDFAFDPRRNQYGSIPILAMLSGVRPLAADKLVGVTERDLFIPVLTFVFGHAQLGGQVAVVSLARLRQEFYGLEGNRPLFFERAAKEALHEVGHMFGLVHCADRNCAMSLSTSVRNIDAKRTAFCRLCTELLSRGVKK